MKVPNTKNRHLRNIKTAYTHHPLLYFATQTTEIKAMFYWGHTPYLALPDNKLSGRQLAASLRFFARKLHLCLQEHCLWLVLLKKLGDNFQNPICWILRGWVRLNLMGSCADDIYWEGGVLWPTWWLLLVRWSVKAFFDSRQQVPHKILRHFGNIKPASSCHHVLHNSPSSQLKSTT